MAFQIRSGRPESTGAGAKLDGVWEKTPTSKPAGTPHPARDRLLKAPARSTLFPEGESAGNMFGERAGNIPAHNRDEETD